MAHEDWERYLLEIARDAIAQRLGSTSVPAQRAHTDPPPMAHGAFVTLRKRGKLRGCVGQLEPRGCLEEMVASCAVASATADPRFIPLTLAELPQVTIEISLLAPPTPVAGPQDVLLGTHGVIIRQGARRGLLLPQVASEGQWTVEALLDQACLKAGIPAGAWRNGASIEVFTARVFSEGP